MLLNWSKCGADFYRYCQFEGRLLAETPSNSNWGKQFYCMNVVISNRVHCPGSKTSRKLTVTQASVTEKPSKNNHPVSFLLSPAAVRAPNGCHAAWQVLIGMMWSGGNKSGIACTITFHQAARYLGCARIAGVSFFLCGCKLNLGRSMWAAVTWAQHGHLLLRVNSCAVAGAVWVCVCICVF